MFCGIFEIHRFVVFRGGGGGVVVVVVDVVGGGRALVHINNNKKITHPKIKIIFLVLVLPCTAA